MLAAIRGPRRKSNRQRADCTKIVFVLPQIGLCLNARERIGRHDLPIPAKKANSFLPLASAQRNFPAKLYVLLCVMRGN
jgi:hypothetical protein